MEFNEYLTRVQGVLVTLNRSNGLRRETTDHKGGSRKTSALYNTLQKILSCKYNEMEMRKIHLYLMFNSDFSFNEEVAKEDDFCHIVNSAPIIDKYLLAETVLLLNWNTFIYEVIVFGPIAMSLEYLEILMHELRSRKSLHDIFAVENILSAVNKKLARLDCEADGKNQEVEKARCKLSFYFKAFLKYFSPPHKAKEFPYIVNSLLSLLQSCIRNRCNNVTDIDNKYDIYSMTFSVQKIDINTADYLNFDKKEDILCLVNMLESNLNLLNLLTWMSWSECKWQSSVDMGECSKTVQEVIGQQAYLCRQKVEKFCVDMPEAVTLAAVLKNLEIKPITDEDEIEKAEYVSEIISKLKDSNRSPVSKKKWLIALLNFSWNLNEEECVDTLWEFGNLLDCFEDINLLQKKVGEVLICVSVHDSSERFASESKNVEVGKVSELLKDKMRKLVFEAYPRISVENQGKLVGTFYGEFGLINCFLEDDFDQRITETLNKAVNESETMNQLISDVCVLCLQSPAEVVKRLLVLGIGCYTQISFVVEVLKVLSSLCHLHLVGKLSLHHAKNKSPYEESTLLCYQLSLLMKQNNWNETETSSLIHLVIQCLDSSLLLQNCVINSCIIPGLEECLENSSWNAINMYIDILNAVLIMPSSREISNPAVILAYILFIMEKGKQEMRTKFSVSAASTCELIISYLPVILEKMLDQDTFKGCCPEHHQGEIHVSQECVARIRNQVPVDWIS